jgi:chromosome partitioning protein
MVLNAKGGCGKSTLATNIASYFATQGASVAPDRAEIVGVAAFEDGFRHVPRSADIVVVDAPARSHGKELTDLVKHAETLIVPVLPSTIDMQATTKFIEELKNVGKVQRKQAKIGTVANRVRDNTLIWGDLDEYLTKVRVPYIAALREAQNELPEYLAWPDWEEWEPLTAWLRSKRSRP